LNGFDQIQLAIIQMNIVGAGLEVSQIGGLIIFGGETDAKVGAVATADRKAGQVLGCSDTLDQFACRVEALHAERSASRKVDFDYFVFAERDHFVAQ
jgi:hypothetical protein